MGLPANTGKMDYNYAWGWVIGYFLSTFTMIVTIYYLIPGLRDLISFPLFLGGSGIFLVGGGWVLGKVLVKRFKIQPIENYISSEVNPFTNAALTAKERVYWNAMVVLLKKEMARTPDVEVQKCVEQMNLYIHGQVPFNFDEGTPSGSAQPLTVGRGTDGRATISPDGQSLVFASIDEAFNLETYPFDAESGKIGPIARAITAGNEVSYFQSLSPDGRSAVYESRRGATSHILRRDGEDRPIELTSDPRFTDTVPRWSPDGKLISFLRRETALPVGADALYIMSADGASPRRIAPSSGQPSWAPDSRTVCAQGTDRQMHLIDVFSRADRRVTKASVSSPVCTISPDGQWIALQQTGVLQIIPALGGESRRVVAVEGHHAFHAFFGDFHFSGINGFE